MMTVVGHQFTTLIVDICVKHGGRDAPRRVGLSAAGQTCFTKARSTSTTMSKKHCRRNWQLCCMLLRHCCWCGRGLRHQFHTITWQYCTWPDSNVTLYMPRTYGNLHLVLGRIRLTKQTDCGIHEVHNELILIIFSKRQRITLRLLYAIGRPSVCRLSVVCDVGAPYSGGWTFRQFFFTIR